MAEHTPGPWVAREQVNKDGRSLGWIVEHGNGRIGWSSYATARPNEGEAAPYPIGAANARVMAAAPDLLECLRDLLTAAEAEVNEKGGGGFILARMTDARAAIAKATGEPIERT